MRTTLVGPEDHGRRMSLERFAQAESAEGQVYELERGVVVVGDVPGMPHERVRQALLRALYQYDAANPGLIDLISDGSGSVIRAWELQSQRHPDITLYLSPPPFDQVQPWDEWMPDIVVEVVSASSKQRDYVVKAQEYLAVGVRAYWIIDPLTRTATICQRRGDVWRKTKLTTRGVIRTGLLPGFSVRLSAVFGAAKSS